ncbi:MAG: hypothetical protein CSB44_05010 [Gammaproteobacteria bacterium]|nr:MAG: hypothetical protein CSB44_05010 [Gammaproteobacteria bacterium]
MRRQGRGFTLVEMAVVMVIVGLLLRAAMVPWANAQLQGFEREAEQQLLAIERQLTGYLLQHGVLPCPISPAVAGARPPPLASGGTHAREDCRSSEGFLPALGLDGPVDSRGAILDPWRRPYWYAVAVSAGESRASSTAYPQTSRATPTRLWTTVGAPAGAGVGGLSADLVICNHLAPGKSRCSGQDVRASQIVYVVVGAGADGVYGRNSDPAAGGANHVVFGAPAALPAGQRHFLEAPDSRVAGHRFDDHLLWMSREEAVYWLLSSGWFP